MTKPHAEADLLGALEQRVDLLCARCDALARELRRARKENRRLADSNALAKQKIRDIIARLPEAGDAQDKS